MQRSQGGTLATVCDFVTHPHGLEVLPAAGHALAKQPQVVIAPLPSQAVAGVVHTHRLQASNKGFQGLGFQGSGRSHPSPAGDHHIQESGQVGSTSDHLFDAEMMGGTLCVE